ncbi:hypothetical protein MNAN1_003180 [Malassezia nana]|uniref:Uncharacterized protein n=1 Tax=Malassezia nana TaxID=180528 RepID=A0AAF0ELU5_9BASI|nr:hypothetical protein MNAN1_003180 [Malassezia nana]
MAGAKKERPPPLAGPSARSARVAERAFPEESVVSDEEEEAAALDADGQGVWDHAFCVVCDCLIETDAQPRDEGDLDDEERAIADMLSIRRNERGASSSRSHGSTSRATTSRAPAPGGGASETRAPLFCSELCRQLDLQRSSQMGEFMNYVSRPSQPHHAPERSAFSLAAWHSPADSPQESSRPMPTAAKSLSTSLLRAETRMLAAARANDESAAEVTSPRISSHLDASPDSGGDLFRRRVSWKQGVSAHTAQPPSMPSNLTRARAALDEQGPSESRSPSPPMDADLLADSPPRSVMLGGGTPLDSMFVPPNNSPPATTAPVAELATGSVSATSPLGLLANGTGHHAGPSVSMQVSRGEALWEGKAASSTARPRTAAELLRRTQQPNRPESMTSGSVSSSSSLRDTRRTSAASASSIARSRRPITMDPSPSRTSETGSDASVRSERRDVRVLPPLLGLPPRRDDESGASMRPFSQRGSAVDLASMGRARGALLSTSLQATSPRRAGLGWSAFSHTSSTSRPNERSSTPDGVPRAWSYERLPGMRMYPIMQLPSAPVHDMYSQYWPPAMSALAPRSPRSDGSARRKSLFHFDG